MVTWTTAFFNTWKDAMIWHAGDIGTLEVTDALKEWHPFVPCLATSTVKHSSEAENARFTAGGAQVWMTHIGGRPEVRQSILHNSPLNGPTCSCAATATFVGHPGAKLGRIALESGCGRRFRVSQGRTMLKFTLNQGQIGDLRVVEWERKRG